MVKSKNPGMNMTIWYNLQFFMTPSEKTRPDFLGGQRDSVLEFSEWLEPRSQPRKIGGVSEKIRKHPYDHMV